MSDEVLRYKVDLLASAIENLQIEVHEACKEIRTAVAEIKSGVTSNREEIVRLNVTACQFEKDSKALRTMLGGLFMTVLTAVLAVWKFGMP